MPTGAEELATVAIKVAETADAARESIIEVGTPRDVSFPMSEAREVLQHPWAREYSLRLSEHKVDIEDIRGIVSDTQGKGLTKLTEDLGDRLYRAELERRGSTVLKEQPQYAMNPETNCPYRADYLFETKPGVTYREVVRVGDDHIVRERVASSKEKFLVDVKHHSLDSLRGNFSNTLEKVRRMSEVPDTTAMISYPEDTALDPRSSECIRQIQDAGGTVVVHAPYRVTMHVAYLVNRGLI